MRSYKVIYDISYNYQDNYQRIMIFLYYHRHFPCIQYIFPMKLPSYHRLIIWIFQFKKSSNIFSYAMLTLLFL